MFGVILQVGGTTPASYRIENHGNCVLVFGSVPLSQMSALAKLVPENSIMDTHLARISGASFAMGPKEEIKALVASITESYVPGAHSIHSGLLSEEAIRWLAIGERGASSNAIFFRLTKVRSQDIKDEMAHPHDPDDLRRCRLLLEQVPELAPRIGEMASVSKEWAALIEKWDDICRAMDSEAPEWRNGKGSAHITYRMMCAQLDRKEGGE